MITNFKVKIDVVSEEPGEYLTDSPEKLVNFWKEVITNQPWFDEEKECCIAIVLDTKMNIKGYNLVSLGNLNSSIVTPREVFRPIIAMAAYVFILVHNHPSGDIAPSSADLRITRKLKECGDIMEIELKDHIIIGKEMDLNKGYYSFRSMGVL